MAIRMEETRHLFNYIYIIHPFSIFSIYWEFFIFIVYMIALMLVAMGNADSVTYYNSLIMYIKMSIDIILTIDILKTFLTGLYDKTLNLLATVYTYIIVMAMVRLYRPSRLAIYSLKLVYCLKIVRIRRWLDALELFRLYADLSVVMTNVLKTVLIGGASFMWLYASIFLLTKAINVWNEVTYEREPLYRYFHTATMILLHISCEARNEPHVYQIVGILVIMIIGYCLQMCIFKLILKVGRILNIQKGYTTGI
ncbi:hypothetical protein JTB14_034766 [Gonioctena quinquepunctata]|nr:hypothetical protein JTB14_034766 [Gonioctena quinquepunctata]